MNKQRYKTPTMARPLRIAYAAYANTGGRNRNFVEEASLIYNEFHIGIQNYGVGLHRFLF